MYINKEIQIYLNGSHMHVNMELHAYDYSENTYAFEYGNKHLYVVEFVIF